MAARQLSVKGLVKAHAESVVAYLHCSSFKPGTREVKSYTGNKNHNSFAQMAVKPTI
jgi:hypothetical protein